MKNMAKILCFVFSLVFVLSTFGIGTFAQEVTGLSGEGTVESPYLINNVQDLLWFRDDVNAGNGYEGKYVKLNADLYLSNIDWSVNIGDDFNTSFDGHFDGGNHTIHNLKSTENAQKSDGFICTGLFGAIYGEATIKNLTINNAKISVGEYTGNNIGVVVGFAYMATGSIENVTVSGDVKIDAPNGCNVGTILGYDYYGDLDINNCKVLANEGSYINTSNCSQVGGIIGYAATNCEITDCTVENLAIDAAGLAGGVVGVANGDTNQFVTVTNATVKNVDITVTKDMWYNSGAVVIGSLGGKTAVINGTTFENVTVNGKSAYNLAGSGYVVKPGVPVTGVAATLNGVYYTSLQDAINAAADGDVIVINNNVILSSQDAQPLLKPVYNRESYCGIYIPDDKQITLDLAGYTISYVDEHYEVDNVMILNLGSLTINDSVGGGLITYKPVAGSSTYSKFYSTIFNCGTLIVNGGTYKAGIDQNGEANAVIYARENGKVYVNVSESPIFVVEK